MKTVFYTDPHLYVRRVNHTTPASADRLRAAIFQETNRVLDLAERADTVFCLGDLFDTYSNPEAAILQASSVLERTDLVLAGNHDVINRKDSLSSLQLLSKFFPDKFVVGKWGSAEPGFIDLGKTRFVFVPHLPSQQDFEDSLEESMTLARESMKYNLLCLHCNVEREGQVTRDTELNLTHDLIMRLLAIFHRILVGHEHHPKNLYDDRVMVIGNVHPTGFTDISDKRILIYDTETNEVEEVPTWTQEGHHWQGRCSELPDDLAAEFVDLTDDLQPGEAFSRVTKMLRSDRHFCVRLKTSQIASTQSKSPDLVSIDKLPDVISADLEKQHPDLKSLWGELLHASKLGTE